MKLDDLADCPKRINALDVRILELLKERTKVVEEIGRIKQALGLPIYEPKREDDVFPNVVEHNEGPLPARIIDETRTLQRMRRAEG